jgi:hypothetical protein
VIAPLPPPVQVPSFLELVKTTINEMLKGRGNQTGSFTLTANASTTTVTDNLFAPDMALSWTPTSANAAAEMPTLYVSSRLSGSFVLTHANNAQTDRTFIYIRGG